MPRHLQSLHISADGKLLRGRLPDGLGAGDEIKLVIHGNLMSGGAESATLLGNSRDFLPGSRHFELTGFAPQADGTCELTYRHR